MRDRILEAFDGRVRRIILFGSRARGDALPDSDYDVLVVFDELASTERHATLVRLYGLLIGCGGVAEPWAISEAEFEETKGIIGALATRRPREESRFTRSARARYPGAEPVDRDHATGHLALGRAVVEVVERRLRAALAEGSDRL